MNADRSAEPCIAVLSERSTPGKMEESLGGKYCVTGKRCGASLTSDAR